MHDDLLSDIEQDMLAQRVLEAFTSLDQFRAQVGEGVAWNNRLWRRRHDGRSSLDSGKLFRQARELRVGSDVSEQVAALSMLPGGVRVGGVVFCARHHREGFFTPHLYGCRECDPDARSIDASRFDMRDTVTVDGGQYV